MAVAVRGEGEALQHPVHAVVDLIIGDVLDAEAVGELLGDGGADELVLGVLEDEADRAAEGAHIRPSEVDAVDGDAAARRAHDAGDRLQQGGLARAVLADEGEERAALHIEAHLVQHLDLPARDA